MESISERERQQRQRQAPIYFGRAVLWWTVRLAPAIAIVAILALLLLQL